MDRDEASDAMQRYVAEARRAEDAAIERALEEALQGGRHGVSVRRYSGGISVAVDPTVPYGEIHEFNLRHEERPQ